MKLFDLYEAPQIIGDLDLHDTKSTEEFCLQLLNDKSAKLIKKIDNNVELYQLGSDDRGIYFTAFKNAIAYFAQYQKVEQHEKLIPSKFGIRQVLIKRVLDGGGGTTGIGKMIFWEYLFPKFRCLISDSQQSAKGRSFWEYRIAEAFERRLTVRMIDTSSHSFVDLHSASELQELSPQIWGTSKWFTRICLVIM